MHKPNLYRPPPRPPQAQRPPVDPLVALSVSPTLLAQPARAINAAELTDLLDDDLEMVAQGGTRIMQKPELQPASVAPVAPTVMQTMHQPFTGSPPASYYPVAISNAPPPSRSNAALWLALAAGVLMLVVGSGAALVGYFVYRGHEISEAAATTVNAPIATTEVPAVIVATAATTPIALTSTPTAAPTAPVTLHSTAKPTTPTVGVLRTFAIGAGQPVLVDGHPIGVGGTKLTTTCGKHSVAVGNGRARMVDIPCSGAAITVGSPDGT